jgi:hypothetical protein
VPHVPAHLPHPDDLRRTLCTTRSGQRATAGIEAAQSISSSSLHSSILLFLIHFHFIHQINKFNSRWSAIAEPVNSKSISSQNHSFLHSSLSQIIFFLNHHSLFLAGLRLQIQLILISFQHKNILLFHLNRMMLVCDRRAN